MHHIFIIHSSVDGHLGLFRFFTTVNNSAKPMDMQVCLWQDKEAFGCVPRSSI